MSYNSKVVRAQGGAALDILPGGSILANGAQAAAIVDISETAGTMSTAEREKFNAVLAALRGAGIIASA